MNTQRDRFNSQSASKSLVVVCVCLTLALVSACADIGDPVQPTKPGGNSFPLLRHIGERHASVSNIFQLHIVTADAVSTPTLMMIDTLPGAMFVDSGNGRGLFSWIPMPIHANSVSAVTFVATDESLVSDTEIVPLNVIDYTFDNFVGPQVSVFCTNIGCHGNGSSTNGFSATSYLMFIAGGFSGNGIVAQDTTKSVIYRRLLGRDSPRMPLGGINGTGLFLPTTTLDSLARWILAGAPES